MIINIDFCIVTPGPVVTWLLDQNCVKDVKDVKLCGLLPRIIFSFIRRRERLL